MNLQGPEGVRPLIPVTYRHQEIDMTNAATPGPRARAPLDKMRKTALVAGLLYLVTFFAGIPPAAFLLGPVLSDPNYIVSAGADTQVLFGAFLDLVNALACIGTAVALYSVVKRQHEGFALGFVTTRMFEAAIIVIGVLSLVAVVTLRQAGAAGADAATLVTVGRALIAVRDGAHLFGPGVIPGLNALLLGYLMYRSRLVPRAIPAMGLIGAPLFLVGVSGVILGFTEHSPVYGIAVIPIALWELSLGLWLTFKGFNPDAPILAAAPDEAGSPGPSAAVLSPAVVATEAGPA